jgi:hypothetical protein
MSPTNIDQAPEKPSENPGANPPDAPWPTGVPRPFWVFLASALLLGGLLYCHNKSLFSRQVYEEGDAAACSLQIMQAKRFELLVGNYSRVGFNHPGPAILYIEAAAEYVFNDWLKLVPTVMNSHILGGMIFNVVLLALALAILHAHFRSLVVAAAALASFLVYFAINSPSPGTTSGGVLPSEWMPRLYFAPFLLMLVATASVAAGAAKHLPWLALASGFLVHGHVSFTAFVGLMASYALLALLVGYRFRVLRLVSENKLACLGFTAIVALFVLPIAIHSTVNYPGEIGKYLKFTFREGRPENKPEPVAEYLVTTFTSESARPYLLTLTVFAVFAAAVPLTNGPRRRYTRHATAAALLAIAAMAFYAFRGVDYLDLRYTGIFFGSVCLYLVTVAVANAVAILGTGPRQRALLASLALIAGIDAGITGKFNNEYPGLPFIPELADQFEAAARDGRPIVVTHDAEFWAVITGVIVELEHRGSPVRVYVAEEGFEHIYTRRFICARDTFPNPHRFQVVAEGDKNQPDNPVIFKGFGILIRDVTPP